MRRFVGFFWLLVLLVSAAAVQAQSEPVLPPSTDAPYPCPYANGAAYQPNVFPRYDISTQSLLLVDATNGATVRVLDTLAERNLRLINWSPDCRYLSGAVGEIDRVVSFENDTQEETYVGWFNYQIVFWDAINGGRIQSFDTPGRYAYNGQPPVIWSPDSNYVLVLSGCYQGMSSYTSCLDVDRIQHDYVWNRSTNTYLQLEGKPVFNWWTQGDINEDVAYFNQYYWDLARGWLWGSANGGVAVYDVNTGARVRSFDPVGMEGRFVFSADGTKVAIYGIANPQIGSGGTVFVYDIASQAGMELNADGFVAPYIPFADYHPVALSPDNRYLVVGYDALRIWDLQNLPEKVEDRLPIYRHGGPKGLIWSVRFVEPTVIETASDDGVQKWDLHTGAYIP